MINFVQLLLQNFVLSIIKFKKIKNFKQEALKIDII